MKSLEKLVRQYGLMAVAIMVAVGFSGVFTYSSLVDTGSTSGNQEQDVPELPSSNVIRGTSNLSMRDKAFLAYRKNVVFVTVMEDGNKSSIDAGKLVEDFNNRMYINFVEGSSSPMAARLGYTDFPKAVAVSGGVRRGRLAPRAVEANLTEQGITEAACNVMDKWGSLRSMCYSATR